MGGAAFLGMALVSGSKVIATLAICSIFAQCVCLAPPPMDDADILCFSLWFLQYVEK